MSASKLRARSASGGVRRAASGAGVPTSAGSFRPASLVKQSRVDVTGPSQLQVSRNVRPFADGRPHVAAGRRGEEARLRP
jgi:hypothetical protein